MPTLRRVRKYSDLRTQILRSDEPESDTRHRQSPRAPASRASTPHREQIPACSPAPVTIFRRIHRWVKNQLQRHQALSPQPTADLCYCVPYTTHTVAAHRPARKDSVDSSASLKTAHTASRGRNALRVPRKPLPTSSAVQRQPPPQPSPLQSHHHPDSFASRRARQLCDEFAMRILPPLKHHREDSINVGCTLLPLDESWLEPPLRKSGRASAAAD